MATDGEKSLKQLLAEVERQDLEDEIERRVQVRLVEMREAEQRAAAEADARRQAEEVEMVKRRGRLSLDALTKSNLIKRLGIEAYNALPLYGEDQPRGYDGRFQPRR